MEKYKNGREDIKKIPHSRFIMKNVGPDDSPLSGSPFASCS